MALATCSKLVVQQSDRLTLRESVKRISAITGCAFSCSRESDSSYCPVWSRWFVYQRAWVMKKWLFYVRTLKLYVHVFIRRDAWLAE